MHIFKILVKAFFAFLLFFDCPTSAKEIVYRGPSGELSTIDVGEDNSFSDVVGMIHTAINTNTLDGEFNTPNSFHCSDSFKDEYVVDFMNNTSSLTVKQAGSSRNYNIELLAHEKSEISHVIETLGNSSLVSIAKAKSSLERAGQEVEHVHPLQFLGHIFSTEKLKASIHNMRGRSWVWSRFFKGVKTGLDTEASRDNILPYIKHFSSRVGIDAKVIYPLAEKKRWKEFVDALIDGIPRSASSGRYDM